MRYRLHVQPFERQGLQEGEGFFSDVLKKGLAQGSRWLKTVLEREGPHAIQKLADMATKPIINTGSNILDKIISWTGHGLRVAGRYGRGYSIAGRGRSRSKSRSRSRSTSKRKRKSSGRGARKMSKSRSRSRSRSKSRSRSRSRSVSSKGSGTKRKTTKTKKRKSPKKKASKSKGGAMTYRQLKPLLNSRSY